MSKLTWSQLSSKRKIWLIISYISTPSVFLWLPLSHYIINNNQLESPFNIILPIQFFSGFIIGGFYNFYYRHTNEQQNNKGVS